MARENYNGNPVQVRVLRATHDMFLAPAVMVARNNRDQTKKNHPPKEVQAEIARTRQFIYHGGGRAIGAVVLTDEVSPIPLAYAWAAMRSSGMRNFVVELAGVCVDPDAKGFGLSAVATREVMEVFRPNLLLRDRLKAAAILLQSGFEDHTPTIGVQTSRSRDNGNPVTVSSRPVVVLPPVMTTGAFGEAIGQVFPELPQYSVLLDLSRRPQIA